MALLPRHLETMRPWLDVAQEIVVVDSDSRDGTVELLREKLAGYNARFLCHPPGIYQSWNFGFQQLKTRYTYVSTVGDAITRAGLVHLVDVAQQFDCDVAISPPDFVDELGRPARGNAWPVHRLVSHLQLSRPTSLEGVLPFLLALTYFPFAILGSSASNVYRTEMVQENPFPTDFGWNGDGAWGLINALKFRFGITPQRVSFFRKHRRFYPSAEYQAADADRRMMAAAFAAFQRALVERPELRAAAEGVNVPRFLQSVRAALHWRAELTRLRLSGWPWIFNPRAWDARARRITEQRRCECWLADVLAARRSS